MALAADYLGLEPHEWNEPSEKCRIVLEHSPSEFCNDFRGIRRWVMCRAWQLMEAEKLPRFRDAIREAWREAHEACLVPKPVKPVFYKPEEVSPIPVIDTRSQYSV